MSKVKILLETNNLTDFKVSDGFLFDIANRTIEESLVESLFEKDISISLALVCENEIKKLNFEYRKKNQPTDVLSFSEYAKIQDLCDNKERDIFIGEIIMCPKYIESSSIEQGVTLNFEIAYILSHGILHLLGFSHGEKMFEIQEKIAKSFE